MGRTSGWSRGYVTSTCIDVNVGNTSFTLLCQDAVGAKVLAGDSGSPVFRVVHGSDVSLDGILWGGDESGTLFVFSPIANIEREDELGPLLACLPGAGC